LDDMIYRRGAPDTFDISALVQDLRQIRAISSTPTTHAGKSNVAIEDEFLDKVYIPGFDHSKGDPTPNEHAFIRSKHQVVIMEGLYLLLDESDVADHDDKDNDIVRWKEVSSQFDLKIFIDADLNSCIERLKIRNKCIPGYTPEEIDIRCDIVDRSNALTVMKSKSHADVIVKSYN
jgi:pantothenate kinase